MKHHSHFKETQLFDWEAEPRLERSSSSFHCDEVTAAEVRYAGRLVSQKRRRRNLTLTACGCAIAVGALALSQLVPLLRHFLN